MRSVSKPARPGHAILTDKQRAPEAPECALRVMPKIFAKDIHRVERLRVRQSDPLDFPTEPINEVELSAEDLRDLSPPREDIAPARGLAQAASSFNAAPTPKSVSTPTPVDEFVKPAPAPSTRKPNRRSWTRTTLVVGATIAAVTAVVVLGPFSKTSQSIPSTTFAAPQDTAATAEVVDPTVPDAPPVRIVNSFDKSEVFEFPPGTPEAEARAAVADLLRTRAIARQGQLEARQSQQR
jgi:hypothetical protein